MLYGNRFSFLVARVGETEKLYFVCIKEWGGGESKKLYRIFDGDQKLFRQYLYFK